MQFSYFFSHNVSPLMLRNLQSSDTYYSFSQSINKYWLSPYYV